MDDLDREEQIIRSLSIRRDRVRMLIGLAWVVGQGFLMGLYVVAMVKAGQLPGMMVLPNLLGLGLGVLFANAVSNSLRREWAETAIRRGEATRSVLEYL